MDPDILPQDDLFGHVNGRWLAETEIPSDRSSWGPFVQLADQAEEQVRALGEFERIGGHGLFGSYIDTDDRQSDRYLFHLVQGGLGLPDESYYREDKFAEIREKYVAYLERLLGLAEHEDPAGA